MRNPEKLEAFQHAYRLVLEVYRATQAFPRHEQFGLTQQIRRSAVSVPSNIVEGCSRHTEVDYLRFLDIAYGSLKELKYQLSLAHRLAYLDRQHWSQVDTMCERSARILGGLIAALRRSPKPGRRAKPSTTREFS